VASQCFSLVRGRVLRATALDGCGRPKSAACASIVTEGFISVAFTANTDTGDEISVTNAAGKVCIRDTPCPTFTGYSVEISFCEVNPDLYAMLSGQGSVFDSTGNAVGFRVNSDVSACDFGVALELWSNVPGVTCGATGGSYGYILVPFLQGGVLGDFTLENDAVTFTITGATTKTGSGWGVGPYNVVGSPAAPLSTSIASGDHLHVQYTTVAPPAPGCSCAASGTKATTATAGTPGTWGPANSYAPKNLADATGVTATPNTAWTASQYVVTADNSHIKWSGSAWAAAVGTLFSVEGLDAEGSDQEPQDDEYAPADEDETTT
jgi:hypothetical protein